MSDISICSSACQFLRIPVDIARYKKKNLIKLLIKCNIIIKITIQPFFLKRIGQEIINEYLEVEDETSIYE